MHEKMEAMTRKVSMLDVFNHVHVIFATWDERGTRDLENISVIDSRYVAIGKVKPLTDNNVVTN